MKYLYTHLYFLSLTNTLQLIHKALLSLSICASRSVSFASDSNWNQGLSENTSSRTHGLVGGAERPGPEAVPQLHAGLCVLWSVLHVETVAAGTLAGWHGVASGPQPHVPHPVSPHHWWWNVVQGNKFAYCVRNAVYKLRVPGGCSKKKSNTHL